MSIKSKKDISHDSTAVTKNTAPDDAQSRPDYFIIGWMVLIHSLALLSIWSFAWSHVLLMVSFWFLTTCIGITLGFHRLMAHRSFKTPQWLERVLATCGTLALQGGPLDWVAHHRMHHAYTDTEKDPHNAKRGFWYSHIGWLFKIVPEFDDEAVLRKYGRDIVADPYLMWLQRPMVQVGLQTALGAILLAIGGWQWLVWGLPVRLMVAYHGTWFVNSACHFWGYQRYETGDKSRNCWWVGFLAWGEGWHNNHHAHQSVAPAGHRWYEIDVTWYIICALKKLGLAYDIKLMPKENPTKTNGASFKIPSVSKPSLEPSKSHKALPA